MTADETHIRLSRALVRFALYVLLFSFLPLLISWRWDWFWGWFYAGLSLLAALVSRLLMIRRNPDLARERGRFLDVPNAKDWDKKLAPLVGMVGPTSVLIVAGLDARFGWTGSLPGWVPVLSTLFYILGNALASWALIENRFFSGMVRIQTERGHHVVDSGPYRLMRHPGYAGGLAVFLFTTLMLGSLWGLIPAAFTTAVIVLRTALEDRTLQDELPGYREYARRTRYRLLPGIW